MFEVPNDQWNPLICVIRGAKAYEVLQMKLRFYKLVIEGSKDRSGEVRVVPLWTVMYHGLTKTFDIETASGGTVDMTIPDLASGMSEEEARKAMQDVARSYSNGIYLRAVFTDDTPRMEDRQMAD